MKFHLIKKGTSWECCPAPELVQGVPPVTMLPSDDLRAMEVIEVKLIKHGCLAGWQVKKLQRFESWKQDMLRISSYFSIGIPGTLNYQKNHPIFFGVITSLENAETQAPRPMPTPTENCTWMSKSPSKASYGLGILKQWCSGLQNRTGMVLS